MSIEEKKKKRRKIPPEIERDRTDRFSNAASQAV
jgi:hypothetical protein